MKPIVADQTLTAQCGLYCGACSRYLKDKCPGYTGVQVTLPNSSSGSLNKKLSRPSATCSPLYDGIAGLNGISANPLLASVLQN